jgi:hypothetical protein
MGLRTPQGGLLAGFNSGFAAIAQDQKLKIAQADQLRQAAATKAQQDAKYNDDLTTAQKESRAMLASWNPSNDQAVRSSLDTYRQQFGNDWPAELTWEYYNPVKPSTPAVSAATRPSAMEPPSPGMDPIPADPWDAPNRTPRSVAAHAVKEWLGHVAGLTAYGAQKSRLTPEQQSGFGSPTAKQEYMKAQEGVTELENPGILNEFLGFLARGGQEDGKINMDRVSEAMGNPELMTAMKSTFLADRRYSSGSMDYLTKQLDPMIADAAVNARARTTAGNEAFDKNLKVAQLREQYRKAVDDSIMKWFPTKRIGATGVADIATEFIDPQVKPIAQGLMHMAYKMINTYGEDGLPVDPTTALQEAYARASHVSMPVVPPKGGLDRGSPIEIAPGFVPLGRSPSDLGRIAAEFDTKLGTQGSAVQWDQAQGKYFLGVPDGEGGWTISELDQDAVEGYLSNDSTALNASGKLIDAAAADARAKQAAKADAKAKLTGGN